MTFSRDGEPLFTYHGPPCDCWRHCHQQENFHEYLSYVREVAIDRLDGIGQNLTLLFLDLKLDPLDFRAKARAGQELARSIAQNLFLDSDIMRQAIMTHEPLARNDSSLIEDIMPKPKRLIRLILSINHVTDLELVYNFVHFMEENNATHLLDRIGFDVGMNDDLRDIDSAWSTLRSKLNLWQGDGYTNCISPFYNLGRLSKALQRRDDSQGYPSKVYHWTIDIHDRMRDSLRMGVDAIMTNHPERLLTVLQEPEMAHNYRLASSADNPFKKISSSQARSAELGRHQRSAQPTSGGFIGGFLDVLASWFAYMREIPFLSWPTTSRLMPKAVREYRIGLGSSNSAQRQQQPEEPSFRVKSSHPDAAAAVESTQQQQVNTSSSPSETMTTSNTTTVTPMNVTAAPSETISSSDGAVGSAASQQTTYEGPKWYTSLASNMLVSFMKITLPT